MILNYSGTDNNLVGEVRDALAGLDGTKIPDDTITQTSDKFIVPLLNDLGNYDSSDQDAFDNAVIAWTAELSFNSWLNFTRLRDREIETFIDPDSYTDNLENKTDLALRVLGISRPPDIPNHVVTIKHDGAKRKVNLHQERVLEGTVEGSE